MTGVKTEAKMKTHVKTDIKIHVKPYAHGLVDAQTS
jgi:hypothetical protein